MCMHYNDEDRGIPSGCFRPRTHAHIELIYSRMAWWVGGSGGGALWFSIEPIPAVDVKYYGWLSFLYDYSCGGCFIDALHTSNQHPTVADIQMVSFDSYGGMEGQ